MTKWNMSKRKREEVQNTCIVHVPSLADHGNFISLNNIKQGTAKEKLEQLLEIRNKRLNQEHDSPYRMQTVCNLIPTTLPEDLDSIGYHRQCYQRFTSNLNRLKENENDYSNSSSLEQQLRLSRSLSSAGPPFPPECIFCQKKRN